MAALNFIRSIKYVASQVWMVWAWRLINGYLTVQYSDDSCMEMEERKKFRKQNTLF